MVTDSPAFEAFPKIPRLSRDIIVTEKIDGTNAQIYVEELTGRVFAGSRNQWVGPGDDGFGFGAWVKANEDALREQLGPGRHFGEWWGAGIQRKYGMKEKRLSLFNTSRWTPENTAGTLLHVVPVLYAGPFRESEIEQCLGLLRNEGSRAAPGFMNPEGIVVFHVAAQAMFKKTIGDDGAKGRA